MEHVLITVVTPLKRKESNGALTVEKVVEDRLLYDKNRWGSQSADGPSVKSISKEFTFGESKRELHRCRLRACLYQDKTDDFKLRFLKDFASSFSDIAETGETPCGPMVTNKSNKVTITAVVRSRFRKLNEIRGI